MAFCHHCGGRLQESSNFCSSCGTQMGVLSRPATASASDSRISSSPSGLPYAHPVKDARHVAHGFAQVFGLHPAIALFTVTVDTMLFGSDLLGLAGVFTTAGISFVASLMFSCFLGGIVGLLAYKWQQKWYGDDAEAARMKAIILAVLVAIPGPIPAALYLPAGVVGFFRRKD